MVTLHFLQRGTASRALVLIHAFPLSSAMYDKAAAIIAKEFPELPIVLVDMPGFGSAAVTKQWTLSEAMADLHRQLKKAGITSVIIGGTSMGGYAVFAYVKQFRPEVAGLILSNTKAEADDEKAKRDREEYAKAVEEKGMAEVVKRQLDKLIGATARSESPEIVEHVKQSILSGKPAAIAGALRAMAKREDSTWLLGGITAPALLIGGKEDALMSEKVIQSMAKGLKNSEHYSIEAVGHLSPVEAPEEWASLVIGFIEKNT